MIDLNALSLAQLAEVLLASEESERLLALARDEDGRDAGDITTASIIKPDQAAEAVLAARQPGIIAGLAAAQRVLGHSGLESGWELLATDGDACELGQPIARWACSLPAMLLHERLVLNLLGRLSGIATLTRRYVEAVRGTDAVICDTRKTTPGLRHLEKYAVRCGGGFLHRIGLYDAALYKDNHIAHIPLDALTTQLAEAARRVRSAHDIRFVEVEVDTLAQLQQVLAIEPGLIDLVLLDNMTLDQLAQAVAARDSAGAHVALEASGGVNLQTVRAIAETGVDRIAVGALTHGASWLDFGLDMVRDRKAAS